MRNEKKLFQITFVSNCVDFVWAAGIWRQETEHGPNIFSTRLYTQKKRKEKNYKNCFLQKYFIISKFGWADR